MSHQPPSSAGAATVCGNCCSDDRWILHNVRIQGLCRKLCTSCVLKLHPTSFCPTCFNLHDPTTTTTTTSTANNHRMLTCLKCSSLSHITCVPPNTPISPYLCPPCSNPSFKFFSLRKPTKNQDGDRSDGGEEAQLVDQTAAKVLLAAAKIAAVSMSRAAVAARADAEKRVKEAALARKRAKEAIHYVMPLKLHKNGNGGGVGGGGTHNVVAPAASNGSSLVPVPVPVLVVMPSNGNGGSHAGKKEGGTGQQ